MNIFCGNQILCATLHHYYMLKLIFTDARQNPFEIQKIPEILQKDKKHPFLKDSVEQLYDNSMLVEGLLEDPVQVLSRFQKFMESASAYELEKLSWV